MIGSCFLGRFTGWLQDDEKERNIYEKGNQGKQRNRERERAKGYKGEANEEVKSRSG